MKKRKIVTLITLVCCLLFGGCGTKNTDVPEKFLKLVFTSDSNDRYDKYVQSGVADETSLDEVSDAYYAEFADIVTESCMEKLKSNRIPFSYDKAAAEQGAVITVSKVELSKTAEGKYIFTVVIQNSQDGQVTEEKREGQIQTVVQDGVEKIDSFFF